jgi:hypothetical protein
MTWRDELDAVRNDPDPSNRAKRAHELSEAYRQRQHELARVRRAAIDEANATGMSFTEIAAAVGISKGRITQIRGSAPPAERAFFGIGPVTVGVPLRFGTDDRMRTYVDAADARAQKETELLLGTLSLAALEEPIRPERSEPFAGDAVVICGPKSAPVGAALLERDERLRMTKVDGRWWIEEQASGTLLGSPRNDSPAENADIGYLARHVIDDRVVIHIAGITAVGSSGVLHYLTRHLADLWAMVGDKQFSMVIRCEYEDDITITASSALVNPVVW